MAMDGDSFMMAVAAGCADAAKMFGFRTWAARSGNPYDNPFPEVLASGAAVLRLRKQGLLVTPEHVVHDVMARGEWGPGRPMKRGLGGRFDIVAWTTAGKPMAAVELKWSWNSIHADVKRLEVARRRTGMRAFVGILAAETDPEKTTEKLGARRKALTANHGAKVVRSYLGRPVECWNYEAGRMSRDPRYFAALVAEITWSTK